MAKNYILNVKDTDGNWVGIPTLIGQQGVGITNITQQNKKLIIDLSNNTRKEFTIPSADLPNGVDILNKIINDSNVSLTEINGFKTKFNIGSSNESNSSNLKIRFTNNSSTFLGDSIDYYFNIDFGKETQSGFYFKHPSQDIWHSIYCNTLNAKDRVIAQGEIISSGDITAFSDIRLKTNIEKIENALDKVCQLSGYTYDMNNKRSTGVIAQEVENVLPEVVQDREDGYKTVAYGNMIGLLIEAIKELKEEIKVIKNGV
jgi:putative yapH protein|nr:MAG TPA: Neck appendage like protein [Caudoviricetes sp.]